MPEFNELTNLDPVARARRIIELLTYHQDAVNALSGLRRDALSQLISQGKSQPEIAALLGITRSRVGQLLKEGPHPERALLGTGTVTIAAAGKPEGPRPHGGTPSTVLTAESTKARDLIADTARLYGLEVTREDIHPPGNVDLSRPNLIVIGSPRLLPFLTQVLAADPHLGFGQGARGIYLTENGTIHRSPCDNGDPGTDYAYLGRLPRPDGKGLFTYVAGIHAMGTLGAATYLCEHLTELHEQVKNRRWSVLIECRFDPDTREIQQTRPMTPIYT